MQGDKADAHNPQQHIRWEALQSEAEDIADLHLTVSLDFLRNLEVGAARTLQPRSRVKMQDDLGCLV